VEEKFELTHAVDYEFGRRRHEGRVARSTATYPVLALPELSSLLAAATSFGKKDLVNLTDEAK
jgi:hypothetical protein